MKLPEGLPLPFVILQVGLVTTLPVIEHVASVKEKWVPVTVTFVLDTPEAGDSVMVGGSTVKVAWAASAPGLPVTVIV